MLFSGIKVSGHVVIRDTYTGEVLRDVHNIITNAGLNWIGNRIDNIATVPASMGYVSAGSVSTGAAAGDTDLGHQLGSKVAVTPTKSASGAVKWSATFAAGSATGSWYEAGITNDAVAATGKLLCRATFGLLTKAAADSFTIDYTVTFADDGV